ncbi:MAG TPA: hypothetical protein VN180_12365, partial [Acidimicrobiia bacterium]|nr:hypothetical protein [Acidimicrobiia bacterium]
MSTAFAAVDPASLRGSPELLRARRAALARFEAGPLPTDADEIWRYSRVGDLDPGAWTPASPPPADQRTPDEVARVLERVGDHAAFALTVDGHLSVHAGSGVELARADIDTLTSVAEPWDAFAELNAAQAPDPLVIDVPAGTVVDGPIVVCHWVATDGSVTFPRVVVRVAGGAEVTVIE